MRCQSQQVAATQHAVPFFYTFTLFRNPDEGACDIYATGNRPDDLHHRLSYQGDSLLAECLQISTEAYWVDLWRLQRPVLQGQLL